MMILLRPVVAAVCAVTILTACGGESSDPQAAAGRGLQPVTTAASGPLTEPASLPIAGTLDSATVLDAAERQVAAASPSQAPTGRVNGRGAVVTGRLRLPNACAKIRFYRWDIPPSAGASPDARIQTVMASLVVTPAATCATSAAAVRGYTMEIQELPPGRYSVQVVHRYDGFPETVAAEWPSLTYALKPITVP